MATRNIVPRANEEGGIGTAAKKWLYGFMKTLAVTTINSLTLAAGAVGFTIEGGTTSKTLTVSSDANTNEIIKGDKTAGRVLRISRISILNGTDPNTIKCSSANMWNGDTAAAQDNIVKNATTGNWSLNADGSILTLLNAALSGSIIAILATNIDYNASGVDFNILRSFSLGITLDFRNNSAVNQDLTTLVDTGGLYVFVTYLTAA